MLLGGHAGIASLGEFSFLGKAIALNQQCSCGLSMSECAAWDGIVRSVIRRTGMNLRNHPYALRQWDTRAKVLVDARQQTKAYVVSAQARALLCDARYRGRPGSAWRVPLAPSLRKGVANSMLLYDLILEEWRKLTVVDSSKNIHKALSVYEADPHNTRVILLTRDGRGVYWSGRRSGFGREESARVWTRYYQRALPLLQATVREEHVTRIRYEDMVENTTDTLRGLCRFLDLEFEPGMNDLATPVRHLFNGNDTRMAPRREIKLDDRWRREMPEDELAYFHRKEAGLNSTLGYG